MKTIKRFLFGCLGAAVMSVSAFAADFGTAPADYESAAIAYMGDRLADPRAAKYRFSGEPYKVYADLVGYEGLAAWAVDLRVRARLPNGTWGGYVPYTVLFVDGQAVALRDDARRLTRL